MERRRLLATAALAGAYGPAAFAAAPMPVVASFSILGDLTRQVGGARAAVESLVGPDSDPHMYEATPRDLRRVMQARVLVRNGLGLEGWMERLTGTAGFRGTEVVAAAKVTPRTMVADGGATTIDPHAWQDPRNGVLYAAAIAEGLAAADSPNAGAYRDEAAAYADRIRAMDRWIAEQLAPIPPERRRIITTHDAFGYYGARYGITFLAAEGISTEDEPSAQTINALVRQIKRDKVPAVFIENMTSPRLARMLAEETGAKLGGEVYSDALSRPDGPAATYLDMLRHNTTLFVEALRGGT
jgi:zinc/manganese transport system substrate-binding protein